MKGKTQISKELFGRYMNLPIDQKLSELLNDESENMYEDYEGIAGEIYDLETKSLDEYYDLVNRYKKLKDEDYEKFKKIRNDIRDARLFFKWYMAIQGKIWDSCGNGERGIIDLIEIDEKNLDFNGKRELERIRENLHALGIKQVSPDALWEVCLEATAQGQMCPTCNYWYWLVFKRWKEVFEVELVFNLKRWIYDDIDSHSEMLLNAVLNIDDYSGGSEYKEYRSFITLVDHVRWPEGLITTGSRVSRGVQVASRDDPEFMLMCFEKSIIPVEDSLRIYEEMDKKNGKVVPLLILGKHGMIASHEPERRCGYADCVDSSCEK